MSVTLKPRARGPLVVEPASACTLYDLEGNAIDTAHMKRLLLCRCGASRTRPLCDGSHNRVPFEAPPSDGDAAVEPGEGGG